MFGWDPKKPDDEAGARQEYANHGRASEELKQLGLYPVGDINAYLRTEGPPDDEGSARDEGSRRAARQAWVMPSVTRSSPSIRCSP